MASQVDICNMALSHIGVGNITSIDERVEAARKCKLFWQPSVDAVLRGSRWRFAGQNKALALLSGETVTGYDYLYKYPSNCLMIRKIYTEATDLTQKLTEPYLETLSPDTSVRSIATNIADAWCEFTIRITDPSLFDPTFVAALAFYLAGQVAKPLTGDLNLGTTMVGRANDVLAKAQALNRSEGIENTRRTSPYRSARG